jgi:hypothetical protein
MPAMVGAAVAAGLLGAFLGGGSTLAHRYFSGNVYQSSRYWREGGGFLQVFDVLLAAGAGGMLGARLGWLLGAWRARLIWNERLSGGALGRLDWGLLVPLVILVYLIYVSNFG